MPDPVLHLIAGPNGAGKSTLYERVVGPATHLEFVNADILASMHWPDDPIAKSYEASALAAQHRAELITAKASFVTETVFSHPSKLEVVEEALDAGYLVTLHVVMVPESLAVARVAHRIAAGGHVVPDDKIRQRYQRLWPLVARAILDVDSALVYDNSATTTPFRIVARFDRGAPVREPDWPPWTPDALVEATR
jgi:predicted ABC-type ATPase